MVLLIQFLIRKLPRRLADHMELESEEELSQLMLESRRTKISHVAYLKRQKLKNLNSFARLAFPSRKINQL